MAELPKGATTPVDFHGILTAEPVKASAPCRIDMGGTLDIATLRYPLRWHHPLTVNIAINLRTKVQIAAYTPGVVKVSSRGFKSARFKVEQAPFDHPLGLMFAVAAYFGAHGIHIHIDSPSPPKSGLGGSSAAVVALVAALSRLEERLGGKPRNNRQVAMLAHHLESTVNMVPCGCQDQLAAVYGGVNAWVWNTDGDRSGGPRRILVKKAKHSKFQQHLLLAYSGITHVSNDINGQWLRQFLSGRHRNIWQKIIACTQQFAQALSENDVPGAVAAMNAEVALRRKLTPAVLGSMGKRLVAAAIRYSCAARFTGAGGGGCLWALGDIDRVQALKRCWRDILASDPDAHLIEHGIDDQGVIVG